MEVEQESMGLGKRSVASVGPDAEESNKKAKVGAPCFDTDLLRQYYLRIFPYESMFKWLSYGEDPDKDKDADLFARREFSFTMADDVYIRYLSFRDVNEFTAEVQKRQPHKIDIGAVYSSPPRNQAAVKSAAFKPLERELVFDIDLTDYDDVRVGCSTSELWVKRSWHYMAVAIKIVDRAMREDFGFKEIMWVFSGRRGVHCWVCDKRARMLEDKERKAVVDYLTLITGGDGPKLTDPLHPSIQKAIPLMESVFESLVCGTDGQDFLADEARWEKVLAMLPDKGLQDRLRDAWKRDSSASSLLRWRQLKANVKEDAKTAKGPVKYMLQKTIEKIMITYCYPRLDVNVSTHRNHLLKSPFVIHPKTGKVCVPILDVANCEKFDPDGVPTLVSLMEELDDTCTDKTSMHPIIDAFHKKFLAPLHKSLRRDATDKQKMEEASRGEW